jgi:glycosyltransferase involved in cell wall biosynthesis
MLMKVHPPQPLRSNPRVSVVIPCYNYGHFLDVAIGAALDQPGLDLEVIVVDDKSTDDSLAVARRLEQRHPQVHVVAHATNLRHLATYEDGLARATGKYFALVSADDAVTPGSLTRAVALMEAHPSVGLVYGNARHFKGSLPRHRPGLETWSTWTGQEWIEAVCHLGLNRIYSPEAVMRTDLMRELGGYERSLPHSADFYTWLRSAARQGVGRVNGVTQAYYRLHEGNMHFTLHDGADVDLLQRQAAFQLFFATDGHLVSNPTALLSLATRALAREAVLELKAELDSDVPDPAFVETMRRVAVEINPEEATKALRSVRTAEATATGRPPAPVRRAAILRRKILDRIARLPWEFAT